MTLQHSIEQTKKLRDSQKLRHRKYVHLDMEIMRLMALTLIAGIRANGKSVKRKHEQVLRPKYRRAF